MRENRTYGSEGGEARAFPTPIVLGRAPHTAGLHPCDRFDLPRRT